MWNSYSQIVQSINKRMILGNILYTYICMYIIVHRCVCMYIYVFSDFIIQNTGFRKMKDLIEKYKLVLIG